MPKGYKLHYFVKACEWAKVGFNPKLKSSTAEAHNGYK